MTGKAERMSGESMTIRLTPAVRRRSLAGPKRRAARSPTASRGRRAPAGELSDCAPTRCAPSLFLPYSFPETVEMS